MLDNSRCDYRGIALNSVIKDMSRGIRRMVSRRTNGFIIKVSGETEYCFKDEKILLSRGQLLFVKKGASYSIREISPGYSYVVNFEALTLPEYDMHVLPLHSGLDVSSLVEKMYRYNQKNNEYGVLSCLYGILEKTVSPAYGYISIGDRRILEPVEAYLAERITDRELKPEQLCKLSGVSDVYLRRIFKRRYGVSPTTYITGERMRLACSLLTSGENVSIACIAEKVGYGDPLYFSRLFKKYMGTSPTEYRNSHKEELF